MQGRVEGWVVYSCQSGIGGEGISVNIGPYEYHLRVSSCFVSFIFEWVEYGVIGLDTSSIFEPGGNRGSRGVANYIYNF